MKRLLAVAVAMAFAGTTYGAAAAKEGSRSALSEGTRELQLSGNYDPNAIDDYNGTLKIGYAKFVADNIEVGIRGVWSGTDHVNIYGIQGLAEYNWDLGNEWVPYVGATVGWLGGKVEDPNTGDDQNNDTAAASVLAGVKYFITDTVAIAGDVEYTKASDDIFPEDDGDIKDDNVEFNLSLRFFIP